MKAAAVDQEPTANSGHQPTDLVLRVDCSCIACFIYLIGSLPFRLPKYHKDWYIEAIIKMSSVNISNLFNVKGRTALVTGGSSGVGFMISKVGPLTVQVDLMAARRKGSFLSRVWSRMAQKYTSRP